MGILDISSVFSKCDLPSKLPAYNVTLRVQDEVEFLSSINMKAMMDKIMAYLLANNLNVNLNEAFLEVSVKLYFVYLIYL